MKKGIAIVTGASRESGIGSAVCLELARKGWDVFFTYFHPFDREIGYADADAGWPAELERQLKEFDARCGSMTADFSDPSIAYSILDKVEETLGQSNVLVNNAAYCVDVDYSRMTTELLQKHLTVNVLTSGMLSAEFAKRFKEGSGGRIINLVSGQDKDPEAGNLAYVTSKGAVSAFTKTLALETASIGITVNAVDPGPTDSGWMTEEIKQGLLPKFPRGRIGMPGDAAKLIAFLASEEAEWITGQIIHSDGGFK